MLRLSKYFKYEHRERSCTLLLFARIFSHNLSPDSQLFLFFLFFFLSFYTAPRGHEAGCRAATERRARVRFGFRSIEKLPGTHL